MNKYKWIIEKENICEKVLEISELKKGGPLSLS